MLLFLKMLPGIPNIERRLPSFVDSKMISTFISKTINDHKPAKPRRHQKHRAMSMTSMTSMNQRPPKPRPWSGHSSEKIKPIKYAVYSSWETCQGRNGCMRTSEGH